MYLNARIYIYKVIMNNDSDSLTTIDTGTFKRVRIDTSDGRTCYCANAWPGRQCLKNIFFFIGIIVFVEAVIIFMQFQFDNVFGGDDWFSRIVNFIVPWPFALEIIAGVLILLSPLFVMSLLSSKKVWV